MKAEEKLKAIRHYINERGYTLSSVRFIEHLAQHRPIVKKDLIASVVEACCDKPNPDINNGIQKIKYCRNCNTRL